MRPVNDMRWPLKDRPNAARAFGSARRNYACANTSSALPPSPWITR